MALLRMSSTGTLEKIIFDTRENYVQTVKCYENYVQTVNSQAVFFHFDHKFWIIFTHDFSNHQGSRGIIEIFKIFAEIIFEKSNQFHGS